MPWWVWLLTTWLVIAAVLALWFSAAARVIKREEHRDARRATTWDPSDADHRAAG